ncbi:hypothetical protein IEN85_00745 [Pelagicoccus sp. NFK12]|uniref:Right handed beta helix domain-containing protein n=1 Tax=Pelagicoccus enzymogenes TaxID=2773457 RepID=A0A927IFE5_9BACT|nr:hypothetical protein [Pelagicoccus enzymogenes]MBD5778021.1 hypothetical protein [Pelagicoccus enzymogenes]
MSPALGLAQTVFYVDAEAEGSGDGSSWEDAFADLQEALLAASAGDEVWVKRGVYYPTVGSERSASFVIAADIAVYGGFSGGEVARDEREADPRRNGSVLSGDIGVRFEDADNCYHVVRIEEGVRCVVDGFVVEGGRADGDGNEADQSGGGITGRFLQGTKLRNLWLRNNYARTSGGGVFAYESQLEIEDSFFEKNESRVGGGLYFIAADGVQSKVSATAFTFNFAGSSGGAMALNGEGPIQLSSLSIYRNRAHRSAGAIYCFARNVMLTRCAFVENEGGSSGAGAIYTVGSSMILDGVSFLGNRGGVGVLNLRNSSSVKMANSIAVGNSGGSLLGGDESDLEVISSTIVSSEENQYALSMRYGRITVVNSILKGIPQEQQIRLSESSMTTAVNLIEGSDDYEEPLFARLPDAGDGDWSTYGDNDYGDLRPLAESPAIDAGGVWGNGFFTEDLGGGPRKEDASGNSEEGVIDIGAYEGVGDAGFEELFPGLLPSGDLNGDGITNYDAYAHGFSPYAVAVADALLRAKPVAEGMEISFVRRVGEGVPETYWGVSEDLDAWTFQELDAEALEAFSVEPIDTERERVTRVVSFPESPVFYTIKHRDS